MAVLHQAAELLCLPCRSIGRLLKIVFAPWPSTYEPVKALLNASSEYEQDRFTAEWRDRKLAELTFVGITCGLVASVVTGAFSWQPLGELHWATAGLWYGALLMSLTSICIATQQGVSLNRMSGYGDGLSRIRSVLGSRPEGTGAVSLPHWDQIYVWQGPIMLLNISIVLFIVGLVIMVFAGLRDARLGEHSVNTIILLSVAAGFAGINYLACTLMLYRRLV